MQRIHVREEHDGCGDAGADVRHDLEHARQSGAGSQRAFGRALDHRAVCERVGERDPHLEQVGTRVRKRQQHIARARQIGIPGSRVGHQAGPLVGPQAARMRRRFETSLAPAPGQAPGLGTVCKSLSPLPDKLTRTI